MEQLSNDLVVELQAIQQKLATGQHLTAEDTQMLLIHILMQEDK